MRNACPNQNTAISIMKTNGSTRAASATSVPLVSRTSLRNVVRPFFMLSRSPHFSDAKKQSRQRQRYAVRNLQRLRIIQRNLSSRHTKHKYRPQQPSNIMHGSLESLLVNH